MRVFPSHLFRTSCLSKRSVSTTIHAASTTSIPVVWIENGTFFRDHPASNPNVELNPSMFPSLNFSLSYAGQGEHKHDYWCIIGPSNSGKTTFLEILRGLHVCVPPTARSFPYLATLGKDKSQREQREAILRNPLRAIQYVGFNGKADTLGGATARGAYLSARYESRREETDWSLENYLRGHTSLNPMEDSTWKTLKRDDEVRFARVVKQLDLGKLLALPVGNLSNGQSRRARIARALLSRPKVILLDEPFLGLDPMTQKSLSQLLWTMSRRAGPQLVLAIQDQDKVPWWITRLLCLDQNLKVKFQGPVAEVREQASKIGMNIEIQRDRPEAYRPYKVGLISSRSKTLDADEEQEDEILQELEELRDMEDTEDVEGLEQGDETERQFKWRSRRLRWYYVEKELRVPDEERETKEPIVQMSGAKVSYGDRTVLGDWKQSVNGQEKEGLWWNIYPGDRWGVFGPNGSGKTTLLSLITSDHPQSYALPIHHFGRHRLPTPGQPGISIFDLQARIGQSSPEVHSFFPRHLSIRQTLESAFAETFLSKPTLTHKIDEIVDAHLRWFKKELDPTSSSLPDHLETLCSNYISFDHKSGLERQPSLVSRILAEYLNTELEWADTVIFRDISFSAQRVALFLRAIIKKPDLLILDEAFSGMDETTRVKCLLFLQHGETRWLRDIGKGGSFVRWPKSRTALERFESVTVRGLEKRQALIAVAHRKLEVPPLVDRWICLPDAGMGGVREGRIDRDSLDVKGRLVHAGWWEDVWGGRV